MTDSELTEFRRLRDKRQGIVTNSAPSPSVSNVQASREALRARADLVAAQAQLAATKAKLSAAQARIATAARKPEAPVASGSVLDQFNAMTGAVATAFYREHGPAIRAALAARNDEQRTLEREMKAARAASKNAAYLNKRNR